MLRKLRYTAFLPFLAMVAMVGNMATAGAAVPPLRVTVNAGAVVGLVVITGGIPKYDADCGPTRYTFKNTVIIGALVTARVGGVPTAAAGTINVTATGGSACENTVSGSGTVSFSRLLAGTGSGTILVCDRALAGNFVRFGPVVAVDLAGDIAINGVCVEDDVFVVAGFAPTSGDGFTTLVRAAVFAGGFVSAGFSLS